MNRARAFVGVVVAVIGSACASGSAGPSLDTQVSASPRAIDELSVEERLRLLDRAQVWRPIDTARLDLREGGRLVNVMRSPEGQDIWGTGVYREIVPLERLVFTDTFADENGNPVHASHYGFGDDFPADLLVTVTFEELPGGKTRMTMVHSGLPAGEVHEQTGIGWNESLDKMAALVE